MAHNQSVTWWIQELQQGDEQAADQLWQRYFQRMAALARQRLGERGRRVQDENDIAIKVFKSLCEGAERGQLAPGDRDELWRLLATITVRKVTQQHRDEGRQKRGGGQVRSHSIVDGNSDDLDALTSDSPTPEFLHELAEEHQRRLEALDDDTLRNIVTWKMEGWNGQEIAEKLGITRRSVERKLERIRELWKGELRA